jgi:Domain of unknown function (DUF5122) beta-propeller
MTPVCPGSPYPPISGQAYGVASLSGRVLVAGYWLMRWWGTKTLTRFTVARLLSDGSVDPSFGVDGIAVAPFSLSLSWPSEWLRTGVMRTSRKP